MKVLENTLSELLYNILYEIMFLHRLGYSLLMLIGCLLMLTSSIGMLSETMLFR